MKIKCQADIFNDWIRVNNDAIEKIKNQCISCSMRGDYGKDLDLNAIVRTLSALEFELNKTSRELKESQDLNEVLKKEINTNYKNIDGGCQI